jgi:hypothetical protein
MLLIADNAERMRDADQLLTSLRTLLREEECRPDPPTDDWRFQA